MVNVKKIPIPKGDWSKVEEVMVELFKKGYNRFEVILPYSEEHKRYGLSENVILLKAWRVHREVRNMWLVK